MTEKKTLKAGKFVFGIVKLPEYRTKIYNKDICILKCGTKHTITVMQKMSFDEITNLKCLGNVIGFQNYIYIYIYIHVLKTVYVDVTAER
jgi:hypothetical protein